MSGDASEVSGDVHRSTGQKHERGSSLILTNASFRAIADIGSKIATAALYLILARKVGASQFGVFAFAISFGGIAITLGQFGQEFVLVREVARDHSQLDAYYSNVLLARVMLSVPPLLIALVIASLAGMSAHTRLVILLMSLGFIGDYFIQVSFAVFQAFERVALTPVVLITQRWVTTAAAVGLLYLGGGIVGVAAVYCGGSILAGCLAAWLLYRKVARPRLRLDIRGALAVTRMATPIGLGMVALTMLSRIDMTMLAAFKPSAQVGQYGAAYRLLETTAFVTWSVNVAVLPTMARLTTSTVPTVGAVYQRALKLVLAITFPIAAGAAILATPIIALLYGSGYHRSAGALMLLAVTITLAPVSSLTSQLLYAQDARRVVGITYAVVFVENALLNLILIPRYSLDGAALGTSLSEALVAGTLLFYARHLRGRLELRRLLAGTLSGSVAASGAMVLFYSQLAVAVPASIIVYLAVFLAHERLAFPGDFAVISSFILKLVRKTDPPVPSLS
jgi:O-antigen/teichoic acid export membrane protein